jgi:flagellar assembly protein FliH
MSTDTVFSELTYPSLVTAGAEEETERARVRGHAAGYAAGLRAAEADAAILAERARAERDALRGDAGIALASALVALEAAAARVQDIAALVLADADAALAAASIELAESILGRELADDEASARVAMARAMSSVDPDAVLDVRLSPVDLAVLGGSGIGVNGIAGSTVRLIADPTLDRGDAVVDVPEGRVDARISSALERARIEIGQLR